MYEFLWSAPIVTGTKPPHRLAHSTCVLQLPASEGGAQAVVFGGAGYNFMFSDVHCLRLSHPTRANQFEWEQPETEGTPPSMRYGHNAQTIGRGNGARCMAVFGGVSAEGPVNDVHIMHLHGTTAQILIARWSTPERPSGVGSWWPISRRSART